MATGELLASFLKIRKLEAAWTTKKVSRFMTVEKVD